MASGLIDFFSNIFNPILDPIFGILLNLDPFWSISIITFIITLIMVVIYKKFTDQEVLKSLRQEMKDIQKEMKQHQSDTAKVMELNKRSMEKASQQFKQSLKPMLITMIPIIIIFAWLNSNLAFEPIQPGQEFTVTMVLKEGITGEPKLTVNERLELLSDSVQSISEREVGSIFKRKIGEATWKLKGPEGTYILNYELNDKPYSNEVLITNGKKYKQPEKPIQDGVVESLKIGNNPIKVLGLSWFWAYFILATVFNALLRKLFKVH